MQAILSRALFYLYMKKHKKPKTQNKRKQKEISISTLASDYQEVSQNDHSTLYDPQYEPAPDYSI